MFAFADLFLFYVLAAIIYGGYQRRIGASPPAAAIIGFKWPMALMVYLYTHFPETK